MARPQKMGLEYFSLDTVLDDNVELMEAECGLEGFAILIKLWQKIYREGYYIDWEDDNIILFSRKINAEITLVNSVVTKCFERDIFNKEMYEKYKILTSKGIQKRYLLTYKQLKRSYIPMNECYLLVNSELTSVITELTPINPERSTQKKEEEKKEEEIKQKQKDISEETTEQDNGRCSSSSTDTGVDKNENLSKVAMAFQNNGFGSINGTVREMLLELLDIYSIEWILEAMKIAVESNKRSLRYVKGILENWNRAGGMKISNDNRSTIKTIPFKKTRFHNFEQRSEKYTADQLEEIAAKKRREAIERMKGEKSI